MKNKILAGAVLISISIYATAIHAQITSLEQGSILNRPFLMQGIIPDTPQLQLKLIHPNYETTDNEFFSNDVSMSSGSYMLTGSYPVGERGAIEIDLPYHIFKQTSTFDFFGETVNDEISLKDIGNIRLNYIQRFGEKNSEIQHYAVVGAYMPTAGEDTGFGVFDNYYDIFSYTDESFVLRGTYVVVKRSSAITIALDIGPDLFIPTDDGGDTELFVHWGIGLSSSPIENLAIRTELVGLGIISEDVGNGDRFQHQATLGGRYQFGRIVPGLFYTLNLNDLNEIYDSSIGVEIGFEL